MKLPGDSAKIGVVNSPCGGVCHTRMMRSASANGSGFNTTALTTVKIAVLTPMPRPRMTMPASAKPGRLDQRADAVAHVAQQRFKRRQAAAIAIRLLGALDAAERDHGAAAGLGRRHAGADVVVDMQLQVAFDLRRQFPLGSLRCRTRRTAASTRLVQISCQVLQSFPSAARNRVMIALVSSHWRVSRSICLRPALVNL